MDDAASLFWIKLAMPPQTTAPAGYQPQSSDTSVEADWILFENLRQIPVEDRHKRFRTFNCTWRNRLWWLCREEQNPIETYLQRRYGADWLHQQSQELISKIVMPMIIDPITFTLKIAEILAPLDVPYYVGGSVASSLHGESRNTRDIDLAIEIVASKVSLLVQAFVEAGFYISETSVIEAVQSPNADRSFNVIDNASSEKADIFPMKPEPFAQSKMARRMTLEFPEGQIYVCTPEDIILQKLKWRKTTNSVEQWNDVLGVMKLQQNNLDFGYLLRWASQIDIEAALAQALKESGLA